MCLVTTDPISTTSVLSDGAITGIVLAVLVIVLLVVVLFILYKKKKLCWKDDGPGKRC